ncbi:MAG: MBL fold metallo-hydrolase [Alphaproteobacteria bacterium]|nr:MBL fold metallo-hydrolase [Alphaproteobacteria bacterium]
MTRVGFEILKVGHCRQNARLACRAARWENCEFPALVGLLHHPAHGAILFDTGYSPHFYAATAQWPERAYALFAPVSLSPDQQLVAQLARRGLAPSDIKTIIISHFHGDHVAGLKDFPDAQFICSRSGWKGLMGLGRVTGVRRGMIPALLPEDFADRVQFLGDLKVTALPDELKPFERGVDPLGDGSLLAVDLPGHAEGQFGLTFVDEREDRRIFLVADGAWSMQAIRENALPMPIAATLIGHTPAYPETLNRLHQLHTLAPQIVMIPTHCTERTAEFVQ